MQRSYIEASFLDVVKPGLSAADAFAASPDLHQMIWIRSGQGRLTIDFEQYAIERNMLYYLQPGQLHGIQAVGNVTGFQILFSRDLYQNEGLSKQRGMPAYSALPNPLPVMQVDEPDCPELESVVRAMIRECREELHLRNDLLAGMLRICVAFFNQKHRHHAPAGKNDSKHAIFAKFLELVDTKYTTMKQVWEYAETLAVSTNYLSEVVKKVSGRTASQFIYDRLLLEAKRLAAISPLPVKEVAFRIGFEDPAQFSKFFKSRAGMNFSEFRKQNGRAF